MAQICPWLKPAAVTPQGEVEPAAVVLQGDEVSQLDEPGWGEVLGETPDELVLDFDRCGAHGGGVVEDQLVDRRNRSLVA
jgi:hypothetical protein